MLLLGIALHVVYHTVLVGGCGQTLGKMLMGVAVVRRDGAPAGYGRALLRCMGGGLCLLTLGLGRLPALFTRERRGLPDLVAGTRPISHPSPPSPLRGEGRVRGSKVRGRRGGVEGEAVIAAGAPARRD